MSTTPDRILVTGSSGFVGRHLLPALARSFPSSALVVPHFDLRDPAETDHVVREADADVCIHLAAVSSVADARQDERNAWQVNLHGSLHLARAILRHTPGCSLLFISSSDTYGASFRDGHAVSETVPLAPMNTYAATKAAADLALGAMAAQDGLRLIRVRPFNHTGPGQSAAFVVASFARQIMLIAAKRQPPLIEVGNLDSFRDFLDVRDVCAAYIGCIAQRDTLPSDTIINLASGTPRRIGDILQDMLRAAGVEVELRTDPARMRAADLAVVRGDSSKAAALIGWQPVTPWAQTLRDVLDDWGARVAQP